MKAILLIFLYLLAVAETTRKFISPNVRLPRGYLEEDNEDYDDDDDDEEEENTPETEKTSVSQADDGVGLLEKTMQNLQDKVQFTSTKEEEEEEDSSEEDQAPGSYKAEFPERNPGRETKQDCKVNIVLVLSCIVIDCIFILLIIGWMFYVKYRVKRWVMSTAYRTKFS